MILNCYEPRVYVTGRVHSYGWQSRTNALADINFEAKHPIHPLLVSTSQHEW